MIQSLKEVAKLTAILICVAVMLNALGLSEQLIYFYCGLIAGFYICELK